MIQEIKDRIPVNVLSNDAIRYGIYDEQGNLARYEYIKREDEPAEIGTPVNKALLGNMQGDLYTVDRYNKPVVTNEDIGVEVTKTGNIFPTSGWNEEVAYTKYSTEDGWVINASSSMASPPMYTYMAFDNDNSRLWASQNQIGNQHYIMVSCPKPIKITKMKVYYLSDNSNGHFSNAQIQGRKNNGNWTTLYTVTALSTSTQELTLSNVDFYDEYRILVNTTNNNGATVGDWQTTEYIETRLSYINNLSLPLTSYEVGKIVNLKGGSYTGVMEVTKTGNIFPTSWTQEVAYTKYSSADGYILEASGVWDNNSSYSVNRICDTDTINTYWYHSRTGTFHTVTMTCPEPKKITKMKTNISGNWAYYKSIYIQGKKDDGDWINLGSATDSTADIVLSNADYYKQYRLAITITSAGQSLSYGNWEVVEYQVFEDNEITSFENPYLNINNLGAKQINGTIVAGEKYSLIYNGESFDVFAPKDYVFGTYTGNGKASQFVNLGFTPTAVIVGSKQGIKGGYSGFALKNYPNNITGSGLIDIAENGFNVYYNSSYNTYTNTDSTGDNPFRYIAYK